MTFVKNWRSIIHAFGCDFATVMQLVRQPGEKCIIGHNQFYCYMSAILNFALDIGDSQPDKTIQLAQLMTNNSFCNPNNCY